MTETSPSQRVTWTPTCTSPCSSLGEGAGDGGKHGCEGEAWIAHTKGRHDILEVTTSSDAHTQRLASSVNERLEESNSNESSPCGRLHLVNELDETSPKGEKCLSISVNGDFNEERKLCATSVLPSNGHLQVASVVKKARKRPVNVWAKTSSRKGVKRSSKNGSQPAKLENAAKEDNVCITLANKNQVQIEDGPDLPVVLSELHKAEKIELSDDKLSASNTKGYRMVQATRGVVEGAWYFEILVKNLGSSGHTRLGWSTKKGEIQAPVGFDNYSFAYRDVDGSKVHKAVRQPYGQPYGEGDVIGFYINLPNGAELAPKPETIVSYKGQPYVLEEKEDPPKIVPGSEIAFFRNGVFQGVAFKDINAGRYFPAASMYTLPNDPECVVTFHFGPEFRFPPKDIGERLMPQPIACAPYCGMDSFGFGSIAWNSETSGLDATHTPEYQETAEVIRLCSTPRLGRASFKTSCDDIRCSKRGCMRCVLITVHNLNML